MKIISEIISTQQHIRDQIFLYH